jgi:hypothetical protein
MLLDDDLLDGDSWTLDDVLFSWSVVMHHRAVCALRMLSQQQHGHAAVESVEGESRT